MQGGRTLLNQGPLTGMCGPHAPKVVCHKRCSAAVLTCSPPQAKIKIRSVAAKAHEVQCMAEENALTIDNPKGGVRAGRGGPPGLWPASEV
ncbi:hypothetical protein NDU88_005876 [Pleurodeles waltl]|uniref:Uncharacterized protein n=1 Tax=Pleurodeles waltl TaxID=8319 RepID=A0AAV7SMX3_PLEWA|nr:hypothetical protein NDU88_005876 [Pleurodeles waltl]